MLNKPQDIFNLIREKRRDFRSLPFWSLNDRLAASAIKEQITEMSLKGCGGYFMHARSGLLTDYMGEEWFDSIETCLNSGEENGVDSYVYDENGWPSGFADGVITKINPDYRLKWLELVSADSVESDDDVISYYSIKNNECKEVLLKEGADYAVCVRQSFDYVDVLDSDTVKCFIDEVYEKYRVRFGNRIRGFFTDEPQYGKRTFPWSRLFCEKFKGKYNYDVREKLLCLFFDLDGAYEFRYDFFSLASDLICGAYYEQIHEWCERYGYIFTGHGFDENTLSQQAINSGDIMRLYEFMQMPGIDWLGRNPCPMYVPRQVSSVAVQLAKPRVLTETFALCGWSVGLLRLKSIAERQYAGGVNVLCQHLFSYSLKGDRKRDYPPSHFLHQSWWEKYKKFNDYFTDLGCVLSNFQPVSKLLVLSPVKSAYMLSVKSKIIDDYDNDFATVIQSLEASALPYELGSEHIIKRHAALENGALRIGECVYTDILLPNCLGLDRDTFVLLLKFANAGGKIYFSGNFPLRIDGRVSGEIDSLKVLCHALTEIEKLKDDTLGYSLHTCGKLVFSQKKLGDTFLVFACNSYPSEDSFTLKAKKGYVFYSLDLCGQKSQLFGGGEVKIEPYGAAMFAAFPESENVEVDVKNASVLATVSLNNKWTVKPQNDNVLVLSSGEYSFDNQPYCEMKDNRLLFKQLMSGRRNGKLAIRYTANFEYVPKRLYFAIEEPSQKRVYIGGKRVEWADCGYFIDPSIRKMEISGFVLGGENEIVVVTDFKQSLDTYHIYNDDVLETEKNKILYDTELENCYLIGDFGVYDDSCHIQDGLIFTDGKFALREKTEEIQGMDLVQSGFLFYSGVVDLQSTFMYSYAKCKIRLKLFCDYAEIRVNDRLVWEGYGSECEIDISDAVNIGVNTVCVRQYLNLRNVFGPHHNRLGDPEFVGSTAFADGLGWSDPKEPVWQPSYCFVPFGLQTQDLKKSEKTK